MFNYFKNASEILQFHDLQKFIFIDVLTTAVDVQKTIDLSKLSNCNYRILFLILACINTYVLERDCFV